ncbi:MAG TPA: hypothetical protein VFP10_00760 [Candidatus Eisenbacteria bacterium]|nr:hypothetical protein [Candidatus Eisenbacteria bacterium]
MSHQVTTELWEAQLPEGWIQVHRDPEEEVYFESPDGAKGVYVSAWRTRNQSLVEAMRDTRAVEKRNLPPSGRGSWEVLTSKELDSGPDIDAETEYINRADRYRIVSRLLGRDDFYVRMTYHDYDCADPAESEESSRSVLQSLTLRGGRPVNPDDGGRTR